MTASKFSLGGLLAASLVLALFVWAGWTALSPPPAARPAPPPAVRVDTPTVQSVEETARYLATLEGRADAALAFRVSGTIGAVHVRDGETVRAGQRLATLAAPEVQDRVERARAQLARAEANVDHWTEELAIDERLYEKGAIAQMKRDQTALQLTNAERERDAAAASLREAQHTAEAHVLTTPRQGVIGQVNREAGETVMPGQPIVHLNAGTHRLRIDVLAQDRRRGLERGSPVHVDAPACAGSAGAITQIETATRPPFESVRAYASVPGDCLADWSTGSTVAVHLVLDREEDALLVPQSAIDRRGAAPRVFRITADTTAQAVPVVPGLRTGDHQQVTGALQPSDRIVVTGASRLTPGMRVHIDTLSHPSSALR